MAIPILSFFTGGGFFDLGFKQAAFRICWTNENYPPFVTCYEHGMTSWLSSRNGHTVRAKIANTCSITELTSRIVLAEAFDGLRPREFGVIGGPPCPDFSNGGTHAGGNGANGKLTKVFVDLICDLQPSFFVIENVPGLYRFHKHRAFLDRHVQKLRRVGGYAVDYTILNALEFGVPQDRERLFVVGFKKSIADRALGRRLLKNEMKWFPWPTVAEYSNAKSLAWPTTSPFGNKPPRPADLPIELSVYPALMGNGDPEKIANGRDTFNAHSRKFTQVKEGDIARKSFKRLHRYRFSPTAWYGNQEVHLHPWKPRRLSVRETLRIQTVPDEYVLPDEVSLSAKFKMICNGVPCVMANHLAIAVRSFLGKGRG